MHVLQGCIELQAPGEAHTGGEGRSHAPHSAGRQPCSRPAFGGGKEAPRPCPPASRQLPAAEAARPAVPRRAGELRSAAAAAASPLPGRSGSVPGARLPPCSLPALCRAGLSSLSPVTPSALLSVLGQRSLPGASVSVALLPRPPRACRSPGPAWGACVGSLRGVTARGCCGSANGARRAAEPRAGAAGAAVPSRRASGEDPAAAGRHRHFHLPPTPPPGWLTGVFRAEGRAWQSRREGAANLLPC